MSSGVQESTETISPTPSFSSLRWRRSSGTLSRSLTPQARGTSALN